MGLSNFRPFYRLDLMVAVILLMTGLTPIIVNAASSDPPLPKAVESQRAEADAGNPAPAVPVALPAPPVRQITIRVVNNSRFTVAYYGTAPLAQENALGRAWRLVAALPGASQVASGQTVEATILLGEVLAFYRFSGSGAWANCERIVGIVFSTVARVGALAADPTSIVAIGEAAGGARAAARDVRTYWPGDRTAVLEDGQTVIIENSGEEDDQTISCRVSASL
jgi:hypothetical protein